jgi:hypothetical protein
MIRSLSRVLLLAAALLAANSATTRSATAAACATTVHCPNHTVLSCAVANCGPLDNCSMFCNGRVISCSGSCIHE